MSEGAEIIAQSRLVRDESRAVRARSAVLRRHKRQPDGPDIDTVVDRMMGMMAGAICERCVANTTGLSAERVDNALDELARHFTVRAAGESCGVCLTKDDVVRRHSAAHFNVIEHNGTSTQSAVIAIGGRA